MALFILSAIKDTFTLVSLFIAELGVNRLRLIALGKLNVNHQKHIDFNTMQIEKFTKFTKYLGIE